MSSVVFSCKETNIYMPFTLPTRELTLERVPLKTFDLDDVKAYLSNETAPEAIRCPIDLMIMQKPIRVAEFGSPMAFSTENLHFWFSRRNEDNEAVRTHPAVADSRVNTPLAFDTQRANMVGAFLHVIEWCQIAQGNLAGAKATAELRETAVTPPTLVELGYTKKVAVENLLNDLHENLPKLKQWANNTRNLFVDFDGKALIRNADDVADRIQRHTKVLVENDYPHDLEPHSEIFSNGTIATLQSLKEEQANLITGIQNHYLQKYLPPPPPRTGA